ncbi:putative selenium-dependent hydroxylase accessory protein YqeC [Biomaibacter acetigenes]|uniref:Putative selenium-dependent hydroxylase accessory protein YqeC n=1 Tax=Biomaibacter acetigenes TaxID=2316383 RepID=A0A3G2RAP7_9FIRM|nr:selenium cofactor biosynthesis protein YqeC [Biomaibacter acetigenes]AYO31817.1 putative selenium-dependent hydroxylase accessory protein YqeC [Biomaibacter acetigenes]
MDIVEACELKDREMIAVVGAGGKTALIFRLARELSRAGNKVLISTTTRMFKPLSEQGGPLILDNNPFSAKEKICKAFGQTNMVTLAEQLIEGDKIKGVLSEVLDELFEEGACSYILVEADGSRRKPIKAPGPHEPVVPQKATQVFGVIGMDAIGRTLDEKTVHRPELLSEITGTSMGSMIDCEIIARLILSPRGLFKNAGLFSKKILVLNKAEDFILLDKARQIASKVRTKLAEALRGDAGKCCEKEGDSSQKSKLFIGKILITSLLEEDPIIEIW